MFTSIGFTCVCDVFLFPRNKSKKERIGELGLETLKFYCREEEREKKSFFTTQISVR
jgi:hypothetical protein